MAVLSSINVLYFRIAFLFTTTFFCFKNVNSILENSYFLVLSQAMDLPQLTMSQYSAQLGVFGILFGFLALSDLIPLLEDNKKYFFSIVPVRLLAYFIIATISFVWRSNLYLHNNAVFIYSFCEIWINFVIYNALREEKEQDFRARTRFMDEDAIIEPEAFVTTTLEIEEIVETESRTEKTEKDEESKNED